MRSFTRVGLPIFLVGGIVFGITFINMYSTDDGQPSENGQSKGKAGAMDLPLAFTVMNATPISTPPSGELKDVPVTQRHLYLWEASIEVGAPGHYEFWCMNRNAVPVSVRVPTTNCQCAGVDLAVVSSEAFQEYVLGSALGGSPLCQASLPVAAFAHLKFDGGLTWKPLNRSDEKFEQVVPAAVPGKGPQIALVRLGWTGKGEPGGKTISAELYSNFPDGLPVHTALVANTLVVPSFDVVRREGPQKWTPSRDVAFGELRENGESRQEIFLASSTRNHFIYQLESQNPDPCVTWSEPVLANAEELASFHAFARSMENSVSRLKSLYKITITVRERTQTMVDGKKQIHQLNLGVFEEKLKLSAVQAGSRFVTLKGRVIGDVTILSGAESGKIELGNSIPANQDKSRDLVLVADRPDLDLTLLEKECTPNYLRVRLDPLEPIDGRKQWRLRVTIPKGSVPGSLPENSNIVLKTNSAIPRKLTIPVRGTTFDAGGPRL